MTVTTPYSTRLGIDRRRYPLGSNHARQKSIRCRRCRTRFDVGRERARLVVFDGLCAECGGGEASKGGGQ